MPYFFENQEKYKKNVSSAAVVIGALRVKSFVRKSVQIVRTSTTSDVAFLSHQKP